MITAKVTRQVVVNGLQLAENDSITGTGQIAIHAVVQPGKTGTVASVASNQTTGTLTGPNGHGITTGQLIDLYWTVSGVNYSRQRVLVGTVSGNSIPISGGTGNTLPVATTSIQICARTAFTFELTGNNLQLLALGTSALTQSTASIENGGGVLFARILPDTQVYEWDVGRGDVNPLAGDAPTLIYLSHGDLTAQTLQALALYNS